MNGTRSRAVLIATTLAFVLIGTGVIAVFFATPAQAHSSTVTLLDGSVLVRHAGGRFAPIGDGDIVAGGDTVRTAAGSHGVLTLFDGTTVELEPDTEITIDDLRASASGDKIVQLSQAIGRTWHVVAHLVSSKSKYEIRTPLSTAAVRGTAFQVAVSADGTTSTETTEGDVATIAQGAEVHVLAGQVNAVTPGSPPQPSRPAPEPGATVRITLDLTQNAIVTDANGRAVGVENGLPVRYIPGSTVEIVDGTLVITIPNAQLGVLSTFIRPDPAPFGGSVPTSVTVRTQVSVKGIGIVANSLTSRPVESGTAKGAVVVTDHGLLLVPNNDARNAPVPHIGRPPVPPTGILPIFTAPIIAPLVTSAPAASGVPGTLIETLKPLDVSSAAFLPYQTVTTTPATSTTIATSPANTGVISITTPIEPIFKTTPITTVGVLPLATATPTPAPAFTLPPSIVLPPATVGDTTVFATPAPVPVPQIILVSPTVVPLVTAPPTIVAPIDARPTLAPPPAIGGFLPPTNNLVPTVPPALPSVTRLAPILAPMPAPTLPPVIIVSAPPPFIAPPTAAPTAPPTLVGPIISPPPVLVAPATQAPVIPPPVIVSTPPVFIAPLPTPAPTPAPTPIQTIRPICINPLLGC